MFKTFDEMIADVICLYLNTDDVGKKREHCVIHEQNKIKRMQYHQEAINYVLPYCHPQVDDNYN